MNKTKFTILTTTVTAIAIFVFTGIQLAVLYLLGSLMVSVLGFDLTITGTLYQEIYAYCFLGGILVAHCAYFHYITNNTAVIFRQVKDKFAKYK